MKKYELLVIINISSKKYCLPNNLILANAATNKSKCILTTVVKESCFYLLIVVSLSFFLYFCHLCAVADPGGVPWNPPFCQDS